MARITTKSHFDTSYHGVTIKTSLKALKSLFPLYSKSSGDGKVKSQFVLETEDGDVFTVYAWKYYIPVPEEENIIWNIGGKNKRVCEEAVKELSLLLEKRLMN